MKITYTAEIEATPEQIWAVLADFLGWAHWLAQDGPYSPIITMLPAGPDAWKTITADLQRGVWQITAKVEDKRLEWQLQRLERSALQYQQYHTVELEPLAEKLTAVHWSVEWRRPEIGLRELMLDWLISTDIEEMLRISLANLRTKIEEGIEQTPA